MPIKEEMLLNSTKAYNRMLNNEYLFTVGKNQQLKSYRLRFTEYEYQHLFGLHKLKDRPNIVRTSSKKNFDRVLNENLDFSKIISSKFYGIIEKRVENIVDLEKYIDSFSEIYDWDMIKAKSDIAGNIMIPNKSIRNDKNNIYIFFNNDGIDSNAELKIGDIIIGEFNIEIPVSFIVEPNKDYTANLVRPATVLYKEKINKTTREKIIIADKLSK
jgi:hypothetical protein